MPLAEVAANARDARASRAGARWAVRFGLADLIVWVVGAGLVASVWRRVRPWEWLEPLVDVGRVLGLGAVTLAVFLGIVLLRQAIRLWRGRGAGDVGPAGAAVAWRLAVVALLLALVSVELRLLRRDPDPFLTDDGSARRELLTASAALAMAGVVAGLARGRAAPRRWAWLSVVWAGLAGVAIVATQAFIPYLVLLALDAVRHALTHQDMSRPWPPMLTARVARAGREAAPVLACCLVLALLLSRELRRAAARPGEGDVARPDLWPLLAAAAASAAGAAWLLRVTLPALDGWLAEGLWQALGPRGAAAVVLGFAGLAAGPAARAAVAPGPTRPEPAANPARRSLARALLKAAVALLLLDLIVTRGLAFAGLAGGPWAHGFGLVDDALEWIQSMASSLLGQGWGTYYAPEWLVVALVQLWVGWRIVLLLVTAPGPEPASIDACLGSRRAFGRFAARWAALTVLMIASMPALFLAGLAVLQVFLRNVG
jgi:hypothetical protein